MEIIEKVGPVKNKEIKRNSQAWLDSEVSEKLEIRGKLFKNLGFIQTKRYMEQHGIMCKISLQIRKNNFLKTNFKECVTRPKDLRLKSIGLPNKFGGMYNQCSFRNSNSKT